MMMADYLLANTHKLVVHTGIKGHDNRLVCINRCYRTSSIMMMDVRYSTGPLNFWLDV